MIKTADEAIQKILTIWEGPSQEALERRVRVLFDIARARSVGRVVELGTYHGYGAIALAYGAWPRMIATVDDYTEKTGWAGEHYGPEDKKVFLLNLRSLDLQSHIIRINADAIESANYFYDNAVSILYIDIGVKDSIPSALKAWTPKMVDGGIVAFRDTLNRALGCDKVAEAAVKSGEFVDMPSPDDFFILIERIRNV